MSLQSLEPIFSDLKKKGLNYISIKSEPKVEYVLKDFIYAITGMPSDETIYDILYIDNNKLNIIEDGRYKYIIIRNNNDYSVLDTSILNYPIIELLK
jgi:hypothetical protein